MLFLRHRSCAGYASGARVVSQAARSLFAVGTGTAARGNLGRAGEEAAARHLERAGLEILARGARTAAGELDLVAFTGSAIVFVEVKARRVSVRGELTRGERDPLESIGPRKRLRVRRAAAAWLAENALRPRAQRIRFDAIAVRVDGTGRVRALEHVRDAF